LLPPLPLAAGENAQKPGFWQTKANKSKSKINFADFLGYFLRRDVREHHVKNQRYIFILSVLFLRRNQNALYFVRCWAYVVANSQLHNEFSQNIFPMTPHGNGNICRASKQLLEFGFTFGEILPPPQ
jgi:hypothetical protein